MNIGFVSTWLERGATYVTKTYMDLLRKDNNLFLFVRGGEFSDRELTYPDVQITWGYRLQGTKLDWRQFSKWIRVAELDVVFFNEQTDIKCILKIKQTFPNLRIGSYIDYYKENTVSDFKYYDFLICNTKRHYEVFSWHKGAYYVPWGTNIELFKPDEKRILESDNELIFFHSSGMSARKGTDKLIAAYIKGKFYKKNAKLIIHTQLSLENLLDEKNANKYNIEVIKQDVPHPGLYYMGDVYVYPTSLDGLGLTIYEALASGLPVIATDVQPINEIIEEEKFNGKLIKIKNLISRSDGYYWPMVNIEEESLIEQMDYYVNNRDKIKEFKKLARNFAIENLNIFERRQEILDIYANCENIQFHNAEIIDKESALNKNERSEVLSNFISYFCPNFMQNKIRLLLENKRRQLGNNT